MTTVNQLIEDALRYGNIAQYNVSITIDQIQRFIPVLNDVLGVWGASGISIPAQAEITIPLVASQESYLVGNSASYALNTNQVMSVISCVITDSQSVGVNYPTGSLTERQYANVTYKKSQGIPSNYLFRNYPDYSEFRFLPVPYSSTLSAKMVVKQRVTRFALNEELTGIPREYEAPLKFKMLQLGSSIWGGSLAPEHAAALKEFENKMRAVNAKSIDPTIIKSGRLNSVDWPYYFYPGS